MPIVGPGDLDTIVGLLQAGEVVAIPTDTVYGLAARADDDEAVHRLSELKGRDAQQPIAVLFDEFDVIRQHVKISTAFDRLSNFWPGALTLITAAQPGMFAGALTPAGGIGVRQPDHDLAREVIRRCGGVLAVTSANRHGEQPATAAQE